MQDLAISQGYNMKEGESVHLNFVSPTPSRAHALRGANPATKIVAPEVAQQLPMEPLADHQVRLVGLNLRELTEQETDDFCFILSEAMGRMITGTKLIGMTEL